MAYTPYEALYTREEHGLLPVRITPKGFELRRPGVKPEVYPTKVGILKAILGESGQHFAFDKYFRRGPVHGPRRPEFYMPDPETLIELGLLKRTEAGINLAERGEEVKKLLHAGFSQWMTSSGWDPEDVLQEVFRGILARNEGKCPFDPTKSSFGHYVHMVINGVVTNLHHKTSRVTKSEVLGVQDAGGDQEDASGQAEDATSGDEITDTSLWDDMKKVLDATELATARMLTAGFRPIEVRRQLGLTKPEYDRMHAAMSTKIMAVLR